VKTEPKAGNVRKRKPNIHAHLPPELLARIDVPRAVLKSIYLLPSVMHRLESLMLASQLREEIDCSIDNFSISSTSVWFLKTICHLEMKLDILIVIKLLSWFNKSDS